MVRMKAHVAEHQKNHGCSWQAEKVMMLKMKKMGDFYPINIALRGVVLH